MSDDIDDLEVYTYRGNEGEQVPKTVEKLIVSEGVQELPDVLCRNYDRLQEVTLPNGLKKIGGAAFHWCQNLLEIRIRSTVQSIGRNAFFQCEELTKVEFECSPSSPHHQLQTIGNSAFCRCHSLSRIKLPSSVTSVGEDAFHNCSALIEANLSTTSIVKIADRAFAFCSSLQTVSVPITVEGIGRSAFYKCSELVAVIVPLGSNSIRIETRSFHGCRKVANLLLPKGSTTAENSFYRCKLLHKHYGQDTSRILAGLMGRFEDFPIHKMCYDHVAINDVQEFLQFIGDHQEEGSLVDEVGMTPFHVLFSTIEPRVELLEALLESSLPNYVVVNWKDANGRRPLDYLMNNWTDGITSSLLQRALQKWMVDRVARWGAMTWMETMESKVQEILAEVDNEQRAILCNEAYSALEHYENVQATSILEMALWKWKLAKSGRTTDGTELQAHDREESRFLSGSDIVIPHVTILLLNTPPAASPPEEDSSVDFDCSEGDY